MRPEQPEEMPMWQAAALAALVAIAEDEGVDADVRLNAASRVLDHAEAPRFEFEVVDEG